MVEVFDARGVSFVAVTQQFNTTTSMGRLTLNVLLSFAQFEREVTGERIRDKIAASKQKGMWMGGVVPLGYDVRDRRLVVNAKEAETVRLIFQLYTELKSVPLVRAELNRRSIVSKLRSSKVGVKTGGVRFGRGALYQLLGNPIYVGEIRHKRVCHPGQHDAIVDRTTWQRVQELLGERAARKRGLSAGKTSGLLSGKLFDENGEPLYSCGAKKGDRRYRYFVSRKLVREPGKKEGNNGWRLPAEETERAVLAGVKQILSDRRALASALKADGLGAADFPKVLEAAEAVAKAFGATGSMDDASGMVERVELRNDGIQITVNLQHLLPHERIEEGSELRMTRLIPMQMKRRGVETRLVIPGEAIVPARTDPALLRMLARGYRWFGELASGKVSSTRQIAMREDLSDSYVRHVVPLGLLAPELVESICEGNPPASLSAERLKTVAGVPIDWDTQQEALAI